MLFFSSLFFSLFFFIEKRFFLSRVYVVLFVFTPHRTETHTLVLAAIYYDYVNDFDDSLFFSLSLLFFRESARRRSVV